MADAPTSPRKGTTRRRRPARSVTLDGLVTRTPEQEFFSIINALFQSMPYMGGQGLKMVKVMISMHVGVDFTDPKVLGEAMATIVDNLEIVKRVLEGISEADQQRDQELARHKHAVQGFGELFRLALPDVMDQITDAAAPSLAEANAIHRMRMLDGE
jgi:hypothetical protein